ncbi:MAG: hypothetical protein KME16_06040 [Scytolyngbya sp. HA4215-MV1]|nr:hypothetical protein [Scytolyngbya sp. HA4215-MV1]
MNHVLHATDAQTLARHRDNLLASLSRRLEIARAAKNAQLIELLEQEKRQLATDKTLPQASKPLSVWFNGFVKKLVQTIAGSAELEAFQFKNGSDLWWYAFDPRTGRCIYADSEAELRLWIETNYQGR